MKLSRLSRMKPAVFLGELAQERLGDYLTDVGRRAADLFGPGALSWIGLGQDWRSSALAFRSSRVELVAT
jgi:hypothetical protein